MDNWGDIIGPIVVLIIYALAKVFGGKAEELFEAGEEEGAPGEDSPEAQRRRVQEEIRRRLAERRQQEQGEAPQPAQQPQQAPRRTGAYDPSLPDSQQRRQQPTTARWPAAASGPPEPPDRSMQDALAEQVARLKKAREQKERALRESRAKLGSRAYDIKAAPVSASMAVFTGNTRNDLVMQLRSKEGVRQAFVLQEVLGKPLASRGNESTVPGLQE